ncbi:MAG TPA: GGDEF domain-containing protein, partial [Burkholderiaceae bacterium]|nr:GGDEF domain-containing protein [Burkholderiaceae bacterium]
MTHPDPAPRSDLPALHRPSGLRRDLLRDALLAGLIILLAIALIVVLRFGALAETHTQTQVQGAEEISAIANELQLQALELARWQAALAFEFVQSKGPVSADAESLQAFNLARGRYAQLLARMAVLQPPGSPESQVTLLRTQLDRFDALHADLLGQLARPVPGASGEALGMLLVAEQQTISKLMTLSGQTAASARESALRLGQTQASRDVALRRLLMGLTGLIIGLAVLLIFLLRRSLVRQQELMDRLEALARTDPLTRLPNRRAFEERLALEIHRAERSGGPLCLAIIDLDRFKQFNDTHGHPSGDALLKEAADAWRLHLRPADLLARFGGEEFIVLLPDCALHDAQQMLLRVQQATPQGQTFSAGVTAWRRGDDAARMLERADRALYS